MPAQYSPASVWRAHDLRELLVHDALVLALLVPAVLDVALRRDDRVDPRLELVGHEHAIDACVTWRVRDKDGRVPYKGKASQMALNRVASLLRRPERAWQLYPDSGNHTWTPVAAAVVLRVL